MTLSWLLKPSTNPLVCRSRKEFAMSSKYFSHVSQSYQSNVARSPFPCASIAASGAFPLFCSAAYQISMFIHYRIRKPFSSKEHAQRGSSARLGHRLFTALPTCEAPTLPLCIDRMLLLITLVSNVCTRASVSYPSRYDTASPHGSDQSRSARAGQ